MRLTTVILIATLMQVSAAGMAQRITMQKNNASLKDVFTQIKLQTGFDVVIESAQLKNTKPVHVNFKNAEIVTVLDELLPAQQLTYTIVDKTIVVKPKDPSLVDVTLNLVQGLKNLFKDLKGSVMDSEGKPLPNASIRIKGKSAVTNTDANGLFEIKGVDDDAVLLISYVGYKTLEIPVKDAAIPLEIKLNPQTGELEEVKVVYNTGYQQITKNELTGSVYKIDNELFNRQPGKDVLERIMNISSGLINNVNAYGKKGEITIRGKSTFESSIAPLIILDNFPYDGSLSNINPNDVESVTILKDASAAAIWGVRAGNGVIVISTKKGLYNKKVNVEIIANGTLRSKPDLYYIPRLAPDKMIEFEMLQFDKGKYNYYDDLYPSYGIFPVVPMSIEVLFKAKREGVANPTSDPQTLAKLNIMGKYDIRDDINKYLLTTGISQQYAANISGGGERFAYFASIGYDEGKSEVVRNNNKRVTTNLNNTFKISTNLELNTQFMYGNTKGYSPGFTYNFLLSNYGNSPYSRLADDKGIPLATPKQYRMAYVDTVKTPALLDWHYKPLDEMNDVYTNSAGNDIRLNLSLRYTLLSWLRAEMQYQKSAGNNQIIETNSINSFEVRNGINSTVNVDNAGKLIFPWPMGDLVKITDNTLNEWSARASFSVDKKMGIHSINGIAGTEYRETKNDIISKEMYGFNPNTNSYSTVDPTHAIPTRPQGSIFIGQPRPLFGYIQRFGSIYSNVIYSISSKYYLSASGRIDQTNNFGLKTNLKKKPLWSIGFGWAIHEEGFYGIRWLNSLKIRGSYGYTGNTSSAISFATFSYTNVDNFIPPRNVNYGALISPNNPGLKWEEVKIINVGIDFGLKNNRISGSIDYYKKEGLDLIGPVILDPTSGWSNYVGNQSTMKSNGFDITLISKNVQSPNFYWNTNFLLSYNKGRVIDYQGLAPATPFDIIFGSNYLKDYPVNSIFSFKSAGLNPEDGAPQVYSGNNIINATELANIKIEDLKFHGTFNPLLFGSMLNSFNWKSISLSVNLSYKFKYFLRRSSVDYNSLLNTGWGAHRDYEQRWKQKGDEARTNIPSLPTTVDFYRNIAYSMSSTLVEKGDHIRLQDIRLSYAFQNSWIKNKRLNSMQVFLYAANLGIIWRANKWNLDPDAYTFGSMPEPKSFTIGLSTKF